MQTGSDIAAGGASTAGGARASVSRIWPYVEIARPDHWAKNIFVLPGIVLALWIAPDLDLTNLAINTYIGLCSICLIASSNYVLNEIMDGPADRHHPTKKKRPVPSGRVKLPLAYAEWLALMALGMWTAWTVSAPFAATMLTLWVMGLVYNVPPVRSKDLPYLDVLSESVNNPLRMLAGWYIVGAIAVPPASLLVSYWMIGCYFMAMKRFAEFRQIDDPSVAASYRKSFAYYCEERLLVSIMFYAAAAMLFFGVFIMRYRLELILAFPLVALLMALYLWIGLKDDSPVQNPENLYLELPLTLTAAACTAVMLGCLLIDMPAFRALFLPIYPAP